MKNFLNYQVEWSDGRKSWLKEDNLPNKIKEILSSGQQFQQNVTEITENGQVRKEWRLPVIDNTPIKMNEVELPPNNTFLR